MSALRKPEQEKPKRVSPRVVIRDGAIVKVKWCRSCGKDKVVTDDETSEFYPRHRESSVPGRPGFVTWGPECKPCTRTNKAHANLPPERLALKLAQGRAGYRRLRNDPERVAVERDRYNEWNRRRRARISEAALERQRVVNRRDYRARAARDPDYYSKARRKERRDARLARGVAERGERNRADAIARGFGCTKSGTLTVPASPFACWLLACGRERGVEDAAALAFQLGVEARRVTSVLAGEQDMVSFDIVDRAVLNSDLQGLGVTLPNGRTVAVWDIMDLYPVDAS